ncbi:uncharacterized protein LOC108675922 isoform X1 [Hyalella azteca]|uniref:Uncharacterized protein LOC108675922 isoform X1 n=1 Tax=Hyalella azteca TaxID=294128 RepID=A0A8B7P361_HYAAZ|nr:uncharacterized protein LOC108675922 isoform X1 [Hyalella azteca]
MTEVPGSGESLGLSEHITFPTVFESFPGYTNSRKAKKSRYAQYHDEGNWADTFLIDETTLPPSLRNALHQQKALQKAHLTLLMDHLYHGITRFTFYPTPSQYKSIAIKIVEKYPYLVPLPFAESVIYWRTRLSEKLRNTRKRRDLEVPAVEAYRKRRQSMMVKTAEPSASSQNESSASQIDDHLKRTPKSKQTFGVVNCPTLDCSADDDSEMTQHKEVMLNDFKNNENDRQKINDLMNKTFPYRRRLIVTGMINVQQLKNDFPYLFDEQQIILEFRRLTGLDILEVMTQRLMAYAPAILRLAKDDMGFTTILDPPPNEKLKEGRCCRAIFHLPSLLKERSQLGCAIPASPANDDRAPYLLVEFPWASTPGATSVDGSYSGSFPFEGPAMNEQDAGALPTANSSVDISLHDSVLSAVAPVHFLEDTSEESFAEWKSTVDKALSSAFPPVERRLNDHVSAIDTTIQVVADKIHVCSTKGLLKGVVLWLALYYILNRSYPSCYKNTLTFLQKTVLGVKDSIKTPMAVTALTIKLNDLLNKDYTQQVIN